MSLVYRTAGPWGAGKGSDLAPTEVDNNFWQLVQSVAAKAAQGVGISHFIVNGDQMTVVLTDATMVGPYTLPTANLVFVGTWQPSHAYLVNQIFTHGGATYIVTFNHTSATTFDPGANDGAGNDYYGLLLSNPAVTLPSGGDTGSVLTKTTTADFATAWIPPTLAGLTDVLPSPPPTSGQVVYWTGAAFSYKAESGGGGGTLAGLSDVLASPAPANGDLVYYNGAASAFTYIAPSALPGGPLGGLSDVDFTGVEYVLANDDVLTWVKGDNLWENYPKHPYQQFNTTSMTIDEWSMSAFIDCNGGGPQTLTIPAKATTNFSSSTNIWVYQGTRFYGQTTIVGASGVSLKPTPGRLSASRARGSLIRLGRTNVDNEWSVAGDLAYDIASTVLPASGGGAIDLTAVDCEVYTITPTASATFTLSAPDGRNAPAGQRMTIIVTTSGTTSFTLTFGTGFKTAGTLATGTVTAKVFSISFIGNGTSMIETCRTTAM